MKKHFGTDGVRGNANSVLTPEFVFKLGRIGGYLLGRNSEKPTFVVGRDTRLSGTMLESALVSGLTSVGVEVIRLGVIPTPGVAFMTRKMKANGGVMISASHNPFEDNGIKFFDANGYKLSDEIEAEFESLLNATTDNLPRPTGEKVGTTSDNFEGIFKFIAFLKDTIDTRFDGLKVVIDCANGAAIPIASKLFVDLGAEVTVIHANANGTNINVNCGSTHPESLQKKVLEVGADLGIAFDGDADRLIAVDELGNVVDGDQILYVCANALDKKGKLNRNTVVSTVMSNFGFKKVLSEEGIQNVQTSVGDRYVLEEMMKKGYSLGGEQSGHIIFLEHNTTGDGILGALQLINEMKRTGKTLSQLTSNFKKFPQKLLNVKVSKKDGWETNPFIQDEIKTCEAKLNGNGRILVRASGTENLIRVMAEGETEEIVTELVNSIATVIQKQIS